MTARAETKSALDGRCEMKRNARFSLMMQLMLGDASGGEMMCCDAWLCCRDCVSGSAKPNQAGV